MVAVELIFAAGRSPHGERGLKYIIRLVDIGKSCRSPHGERGLKWVQHGPIKRGPESLSSRRAWIEIWTCGDCPDANAVALLTESVD